MYIFSPHHPGDLITLRSESVYLSLIEPLIFCYAVLKSSGSAFENFVRDEFTTLVEVNDRIFSTSVDVQYNYTPIALGAAKEEDLAKIKDEFLFDKVATRAREITLDVFAIDESASVQVCASFHSAVIPSHVSYDRPSAFRKQ